MTHILIFAGILIAVGVSVLVIAICNRPKKAEESERGEIIKQLLALSEAEASTPSVAPAPIRRAKLTLASTKPTSVSANGANRESNPKRKYVPPGAKSPVVLVSPKNAEVEEQIRKRAYELYQQRGGVHGTATDDWLQATEEVLRSGSRASKTVSRQP
jgi:hypothetical protein